MSGLDWAGLLRAGLGQLRLTPEQFWRLSPAELRIMLGAEATAAPLTRARLQERARAVPDVTKGASDGAT